VQVFAVMVAVAFTTWYAPHTLATSLQAAGQPTDPPAPVWVFWRDVATYVAAVGAVSLVFDGGPPSLGIGLVIVGAGLREVCRRRARSSRSTDAAIHRAVSPGTVAPAELP
jgi:hypothetical protein